MARRRSTRRQRGGFSSHLNTNNQCDGGRCECHSEDMCPANLCCIGLPGPGYCGICPQKQNTRRGGGRFGSRGYRDVSYVDPRKRQRPGGFSYGGYNCDDEVCMCDCWEINSPVEGGSYVTVECPGGSCYEWNFSCEQCCWHKCGSLGPGSNIQM